MYLKKDDVIADGLRTIFKRKTINIILLKTKIM